MKHVKIMTSRPEQAMTTADILTLVGSIMGGVGTILVTIARYVGGGKAI